MTSASSIPCFDDENLSQNAIQTLRVLIRFVEDFAGGWGRLSDKGLGTPEFVLWLHAGGQEDVASHPVRLGLHGTNQYEPFLKNLKEVWVLGRL